MLLGGALIKSRTEILMSLKPLWSWREKCLPTFFSGLEISMSLKRWKGSLTHVLFMAPSASDGIDEIGAPTGNVFHAGVFQICGTTGNFSRGVQ